MRLHHNIPYFYFLAATMMPGGTFLRHTAAFVWSSSSRSSRRNLPTKVGGAFGIAKSRRIPCWQLVRGGNSNYFAPSSSAPAAAASNPVTLQAGSTTSVTEEVINKEAQKSLSIVGSSVKLDTLEGIEYLNTKDCNEFRVLFVLGGPGAGKGTQSDLLKENYPCVHLSAGELLRAETTKEDSPHKELIESCLVSGNIVPVEISLSLLEAAMKEAAKEHGTSLIFLVDGFPRNFDNLDGWIRCMKGVATAWGILDYQCPLEELERRILNRSEDSGRSDDNLQSARKRFATFDRDTVPVVDTLRRVECLLKERNQPALHVFYIRGDQTVEEVWSDTQDAMNRIISYDVLTAQSQLFESIRTQNVDLYRQLCADEWFEEGKTAEEIMALQEGNELGLVSNVQLSYISGTKVAVQYDHVLDGDIKVQEKRIWSHQGTMGWKNIHFARIPTQN